MLHLFDKNTVKTNIAKYYYNLKEKFSYFNLFLMAKRTFQQPLLQSSVSHDPSESSQWNSSKEQQHLVQIELFFNIKNYLLNQFNASLLDERIQISLTDPILLMLM